MKGRTPTAAEQRYMDAAGQLGCIVCRVFLGEETPDISMHHIDGRTKPGAHFKSIPLCGGHHQLPDVWEAPRWLAFHINPTAFAALYATQYRLLAMTIGLLNEQGYDFDQIGDEA